MLCIRFQEQRLLDPFAASLDVIGTEAWKEDKKNSGDDYFLSSSKCWH